MLVVTRSDRRPPGGRRSFTSTRPDIHLVAGEQLRQWNPESVLPAGLGDAARGPGFCCPTCQLRAGSIDQQPATGVGVASRAVGGTTGTSVTGCCESGSACGEA